jgi:hypothetical protein
VGGRGERKGVRGWRESVCECERGREKEIEG